MIKFRKLSIFMLLFCYFILPKDIFAADTELNITALNVGAQGDSVLLESKGNYLLMDTGLYDNGIYKNNVINYLKSNNINKLDLYLSHWHNDHYGEISNIINDSYFTINNIYLPPQEFLSKVEYDKTDYDKIINSINSKKTKITYLKIGTTFSIGDAKANVIGPIGEYSLNDHIEGETVSTVNNITVGNNYSVVTKITVGNTKYLTAGDTEILGEQRLLESKIDLTADIMKLSHHGGLTSSSDKFMKAVNPKYTFFSSETCINSLYNTTWTVKIPNINSFANVMGTEYNGNITYSIKNDNISVKADRNYKSVKVHYIDTDTNKEIITKSFPFSNSSKYYLYTDNIPTYTYVKSEGLLNGNIDEAKDVYLYYKKNLNTITINFINKSDSSSISDSKTITLEQGSNFDLSKEVKDFEGYSFIESSNELTGTLNENIVIQLLYEKNSIIDVPNTSKKIGIILIIGLICIFIGTILIKNKTKKQSV